MGDKTEIAWCDATWNPTSGCTRVSEGCRHCYIDRTPPFRMNGRKFVHGTTGVQLHPDRLAQPLKWKTPRRIFVNSLSDLFHEDVPDAFIDRVFAVMGLAHQHTFQILTKRPERMRTWFRWVESKRGDLTVALVKKGGAWPKVDEYSAESVLCAYCARDVLEPLAKITWAAWPLPNVWLGVSIEDQETADKRIPLLLQTTAAVRFVSAEPLLGPVDLAAYLQRDFVAGETRPPNAIGGTPYKVARLGAAIDWTIVGGESGPGARPMHPDWARSIRDQCQAAGVPFFFKQWGEWAAMSQMPDGETPGCSDYHRHAPSVVLHPDGQQNRTYPKGAMTMLKVGKKLAGSMLDGREWKEWPHTQGSKGARHE